MTLVDTLELEPVVKIKWAFLITNEKIMKMRSKQNGYEYTLRIGWTTPEYRKYIDEVERKKAIENIEYQLKSLNC